MSVEVVQYAGENISSKKIISFAEKCLKKMRVPKGYYISIVIGGKQRIQSLNKEHRGKDYPTDVLSFGSLETQKNGWERWGELFICYEVAQQQARDQKHALWNEIQVLIVHGLLHLLGYDHQNKKELLKMQQKEKFLIQGGLTHR